MPLEPRDKIEQYCKQIGSRYIFSNSFRPERNYKIQRLQILIPLGSQSLLNRGLLLRPRTRYFQIDLLIERSDHKRSFFLVRRHLFGNHYDQIFLLV